MTPQTGTALLIIAAFVLPGFVTVLLRERTYHVRAGTDSFELLLTARCRRRLKTDPPPSVEN